MPSIFNPLTSPSHPPSPSLLAITRSFGEMPEQHKIFVIAKVGAYYRCLASLTHDGGQGQIAIENCIGVLRIFSDVANKVALQQELATARDFFRGNNDSLSASTVIPGQYCPPPSNFINTCLVLGASLNPDERNVYRHVWAGHFAIDDNSASAEDFTVFDITDLNQVKYCFCNFKGNRTNSLHVLKQS